MKTLLLLISLFCNENHECAKEMSVCMERKIWDYTELEEYHERMSVYAFHECLNDKGFLKR